MQNKDQIIDLILPVSNNFFQTKRCINFIFKNTDLPFRLIIVDNGIEDRNLLDFLTHLKQNNNNVSLVAKDKNTSFTACLNKGLEISKSQIVGIIHPHIIVSKNWLSKLIQVFSDKNAGIVAPRCNNDLLPNISVNFNEKIEIIPQLEYFNKFLENSSHPNFSEIPFTIAYCALINREVIAKCGGFDTIFENCLSFADFDLCFRAAKKGFKTYISNRTIVYYDKGAENQEITKNRIPINFTIFRQKWKNHPDIKYIPANLFPTTTDHKILKDDDGFYYDKNLKSEHKKYLLIHPSITETGNIWETSYLLSVSPSGLLRVAHYLVNQGEKVAYYDFEPYDYYREGQKSELKSKAELFVYGKPLEDFEKYIRALQDIDEVYITMTMTFHYPHLPKIIEKIKEVFGNIKITVGGVYPSLCPDEMKKLGVDVHVGPYHNADSYRPLIELTSGKDSAIMRIIKGCPRTCSYCVVPNLEGRKITEYQKEAIINHFQEYYSMGYTNYIFWDSNLLFGKENLYVLLNYLIDYGYNESITLDFSYGLEFALINDQFIEILSKFKLKNALYVPIESSEYDLYKTRFHRPNSHLGVITETVEKLKAANYKNMSFYIMTGLPNQTLEQIIKTMIFGWRLGLSPKIMMYTPIPGTEEFPKYLDFYKDKEHWELNPYLFPCESEELTKETLLYLHKLDHYTLAYTEEEGFFLQKYVVDPIVNSTKEVKFKLLKLHFEEQNPILKRFHDLLIEEDIRQEEINNKLTTVYLGKEEELDEKTFRFYHNLTI